MKRVEGSEFRVWDARREGVDPAVISRIKKRGTSGRLPSALFVPPTRAAAAAREPGAGAREARDTTIRCAHH